jgi:hypothetical protein
LFYFYPADGIDNSISSAELAEKLRDLPARRLVVVMDACDSGALLAPLEGVLAARLREALSRQVPATPAPPESNSQGALLLAASAGIEDAVGGTAANPFLDRLLEVLTSKDGQSTLAHDIASKMSAPLLLEQEHGPPITTTPVAIHIGADFAVTK